MSIYIVQSRSSLKFLKLDGKSSTWVWEIKDATQFATLLEAQPFAKEYLEAENSVVLAINDSEIEAVYEPEFLVLKYKAS
jgi:predicted DNA binding CopG/RHH family protein